MDDLIIEPMGGLEFTSWVGPKMKPMARSIQNKLRSGFNPHGIQAFWISLFM